MTIPSYPPAISCTRSGHLKYSPPFPWFGGKSKVAAHVWERFGDVPHYVEPFFGAGAVLFLRPHFPQTETINDKDGFVCNFFRAVQNDPASVALFADQPVNANDLHARHSYLVNRRAALTSQLEGNPEYFDSRLAGWWAWGVATWLGEGWCSPGTGPWFVRNDLLVRIAHKERTETEAGEGVRRSRPHLTGGRGAIHGATDRALGITRRRPHIGTAQGIHGKTKSPYPPRGPIAHTSASTLYNLISLYSDVSDMFGTTARLCALTEYFEALSNRLRRVRVCCGDWTAICTPSVTYNRSLTGVFLDPPYAHSTGRDAELYSTDTPGFDTQQVRDWCILYGNNPLLRIALCGYEGEHDVLATEHGWSVLEWKTAGGYDNISKSKALLDDADRNKHKERIWFSPHCLTLPPVQLETPAELLPVLDVKPPDGFVDSFGDEYAHVSTD